MISRRSRWLLIGTTAAPASLLFSFLDEWRRRTGLKAKFPEFTYIDSFPPWYAVVFYFLFVVGLFLGLLSVVSIALDLRKIRTNAGIRKLG
jgi:hypothetical protein